VGAENRVTAFHQRLRRAIGLVVMVHGRSCMVARCGLLTRLVGAEKSVRSCDQPILVYEAAEATRRTVYRAKTSMRRLRPAGSASSRPGEDHAVAEQGALAARLLLDLLDGTLEGDVDVIVPTRLVVRGSTGAPYVGAADGVVDGTRRMAQCQRR
jgi:hypothetical protein